MDAAYAPWIALACGIIGMLIGYFMGYRTGRIAGELDILKSTRSRRDRSRKNNRTSAPSGQGRNLDAVEASHCQFRWKFVFGMPIFEFEIPSTTRNVLADLC